MKYNVGDKVRVKSLEWFFNNYEVYGKIIMGNHIFTASMAKYCGGIVTIDYVCNDSYQIKEDDEPNGWTDDMFEGLAEEGMYDEEFKNAINVAYNACLDEYNEVPNKLKIDQVFISDKNYQDKVELCLGDDYKIVIEDGRTFVQRKKPKYPKTYEECCKIMGIQPDNIIITNCSGLYGTKYESNLINKFGALWELIICRGAYWKIAGDWKPDWADNYQKKWIINFYQDEINLTNGTNVQFILAFPTEEIRDAFYKNFKELIEKCINFI